MDHLVFCGAGDAALTRRASKYSGMSAVVVRFSRSRRRYERQGILVEQPALERAEVECLAEEEAPRLAGYATKPGGRPKTGLNEPGRVCRTSNAPKRTRTSTH
jgi:hypothetical protein